MAEFVMPSLGADMDEGTVVEWRVAPGDVVHRGDVVAVIDTEKSDIEAECFVDGTVAELLVDVGTTVPVGTPLARIDTAAHADAAPSAAPAGPATLAAPAPAAPAPATPAPATPDAHAAPAPGTAAPPTAGEPPHRTTSPLVRHLVEAAGVDLEAVEAGPDGVVHRAAAERAATQAASAQAAAGAQAPTAGSPPTAPSPAGRRSVSPPAAPPETRRRITPHARRVAAERGLTDDALAALAGTGPDGALVAADLPEAPARRSPAAEPAGARPRADAEAPGRRGQAATAALMARSKREIPHFYLDLEVDLHDALAWLADRNADRTPLARVLPASLLVAATARAAAEHPATNGWWIDDGFRPSPTVDVGMAVSRRGGGLVAGAVGGADRLGLDDLDRELKDLVAAARRGRLRSSQTTASITVTNLGDQGVDRVYGVIHPPQVAVVGFGTIAERAVAHDGMLAARPTVVATLAADHRAVDGHLGSRFLRRVADLLADPQALADPPAAP